MMDQPILFHKPNKKVRSEKKMDHFSHQTKHTLKLLVLRARTHMGLYFDASLSCMICIPGRR
jgi:hypothetical protein